MFAFIFNGPEKELHPVEPEILASVMSMRMNGVLFEEMVSAGRPSIDTSRHSPSMFVFDVLPVRFFVLEQEKNIRLIRIPVINFFIEFFLKDAAFVCHAQQ